MCKKMGVYVMDDHWYKYSLYKGNETFKDGIQDLDFNVLDFWRYAYSNLIDTESEIAEFLVGHALGLVCPTNKLEWASYDIKYEGTRIEVKETGYTHTWTRKQSKIRRFDIKSLNGTRHCDIYVFCLVGQYGEDVESFDPLDLSIWKFFVVPRTVIDTNCGEEKTLSLEKLHSLGYSPIRYQEIKNTVDTLIQQSKQLT